MMSIQKMKKLEGRTKKLENDKLEMYELQKNVIEWWSKRKIWKRADKEKRKNNLVVYNVPESGKDESRERVEENTQKLNKILRKKLQVENWK